ncbi:hypothetical protein [Nonomuraea cavernae]|uniref:Uncharacterized protein n=1 Tax=Nonomuraea cavernae TaxID=2045107 RepID=A0A917Z1F7_9ACTN|nr:hypothetical protein [Nonomuraea cavernae]MCA2187906.1 hypothetical protein [Nonomuraea cavernae]GGO72208.1 hypothetical protein GCM10012289_39720 [Nonomuraea cavernae]
MIVKMTAPPLTGSVAEHAHDESAGFEPIRRRGLLGILSKGGIALVGGIATIVATSSQASADGYHKACCHLARNNNCSRGCPSNCSFCCPSGWTKRSWGCIAGVRPITCGECQKGGTSCWNGTSYTCSVMIDQNAC